jgi:F-type H+-transporting ATPase subunit delta
LKGGQNLTQSHHISAFKTPSRALAARYAKALFDVALQEGDPVRAGEQLSAFAGLVSGHDDLRRVLQHPAVPAKMKHGVTAQLAERAGLDAPLRKLLLLLADRDRLSLLPDLDAAYRARVLQHQQVVEAHLTTAAAIPADRADAISRGLAAKTGRTVQLSASVDPALIGGAVTRIGSTVYDGSVSRQLDRLRERLAQDA